jgi:hypothetical protein
MVAQEGTQPKQNGQDLCVSHAHTLDAWLSGLAQIEGGSCEPWPDSFSDG